MIGNTFMLNSDDSFGPPFPIGLTALPEKVFYYAADVYFREGWEDLVLCAGQKAAEIAARHTLVLIKPEAIVARRAERILEWLGSSGFHVVGAAPVQMNRHVARALWQYQWNLAARDRKDACDLMLAGTPAIAVIVRAPADGATSAAQTFAALKGPADPAQRKPGQLRHMLGGTSTQMNFIHSADEPADVVRELAVLVDHDLRMEVMRDMVAGSDRFARAWSIHDGIAASAPRNELSLDAALERLLDAARKAGSQDCARLLDDMKTGQSGDWRGLQAALGRCGASFEAWDLITVANHMIEMDLPGVRFLIPSLRAVRSGDPRVSAASARRRDLLEQPI